MKMGKLFYPFYDILPLFFDFMIILPLFYDKEQNRTSGLVRESHKNPRLLPFYFSWNALTLETGISQKGRNQIILCVQDNLSMYFSNLSLIFNNKTINYITDQLILGVMKCSLS